MNKFLPALVLIIAFSELNAFSGNADGTSFTIDGSNVVGSSRGLVDGSATELISTSDAQPVGVYAVDDSNYFICLGTNPVCSTVKTKPTPEPGASLKASPVNDVFSIAQPARVTKQYALSNDGNEDLNAFECSIDFFNKDWVEVVNCPSDLNVGENKVVDVLYKSRDTSLGVHAVTLSFGNADAKAESKAEVIVFDSSGGPGNYSFQVLPNPDSFNLDVNETQTR